MPPWVKRRMISLVIAQSSTLSRYYLKDELPELDYVLCEARTPGAYFFVYRTQGASTRSTMRGLAVDGFMTPLVAQTRRIPHT